MKPEHITFKELSVNFSNLEEWFGKNPFRTDYAAKENSIEEYRIVYRRPEPIRTNVHDLRIEFIHHLHISHLSYKAPKLDWKAWITIESDDELPFEKWLSVIQVIRNFLSLASIPTGVLVYPLYVFGRTRQNESTDTSGATIYPSIDIVFHYGDMAIPSRDETVRYWLMLFRFKDISRQVGLYLQNWFDKSETLRPMFDLFFGSLYNRRRYITDEFLSLVQAIESYHSRTMKNYVLQEDQYNKMIEEILQNVPIKYRDWLDKALEGSNQPSLRAGLDETINNLKLIDFIGKNKSELESFVHKITVTRHYLTHYGKQREREAIPPEKLSPYIMRLRLILLACLLKEVGFGIGEIKPLIRKYSETFLPL